MPTFWDAFIKEYKDEIPNTPLCRILMAFFHYTVNEPIECKRLMRISV